MQEAGQKLRRVREHLGLRYRDVEEESQRIAVRRGNHEFAIGLSRLADIENKGTVPSVYRLYSLSAIYRLDFSIVLAWYGVELGELPREAAGIAHTNTHPLHLAAPDAATIELPVQLQDEFDPGKTAFFSKHIGRWGKLPLALLNSIDPKTQAYGFIGTQDWSMYPIIPPGSFIQIDESKRRIVNGGWTNEHERPIYFVEERNGYRCGWCTVERHLLIVQPHSASEAPPQIFRYPGEVNVIGQVVGIAMRLDPAKRRHTRS